MPTAREIIEKRKMLKDVLDKELASNALPSLTIGDLFITVEEDGSLFVSIEGFNTNLPIKYAIELFKWGSKLYPANEPDPLDNRPWKSPPLCDQGPFCHGC